MYFLPMLLLFGVLLSGYFSAVPLQHLTPTSKAWTAHGGRPLSLRHEEDLIFCILLWVAVVFNFIIYVFSVVARTVRIA